MNRSVRLYALLARSAPRAVVFRRGPTKQVLLLAWNTETDAFEEGQWLKARIYERRGDLSPDGRLLLYFAANHREPYFSWTAVSQPPYLTALAFWPKGNAWGGGGHFETDRRIALNHTERESALAEGFRLPTSIDVHPFGEASGWGEDHPVWSRRLERDGWTMVSSGRIASKSSKAPIRMKLDPPILWEKRHPIAPEQYVLRMTISGLAERNQAWYVTDHAVVENGVVSHDVGRSDWADWDRSGDLLFSRGASLYRLQFADGQLASLDNARELIDLSAHEFVAREAPASVRQWPRRTRRR